MSGLSQTCPTERETWERTIASMRRPRHATATTRKRPRRVQKKIDQRFGSLRHSGRMHHAIKSLAYGSDVMRAQIDDINAGNIILGSISETLTEMTRLWADACGMPESVITGEPPPGLRP